MVSARAGCYNYLIINVQVYRVNEAGIKFMQLYHIETYPNIAIIDPRTGIVNNIFFLNCDNIHVIVL